jgi:hypothetical protein
MQIKKVHAYIFILFVIKLGYAFANFYIYDLDFGKLIIGHDELGWQDDTIFFYEHGLGLDAIKMAFSQPNAFETAGWPFLVGIFHNIFGLSYSNVIWVRMVLFYFAANSFYSLIVNANLGRKRAWISVLFLTFYHPFVAADATYLRDDVIVYLIIILLWLSSVKKHLYKIIAIPLFLFLFYILLLTRPLAILVFISLYLFYFKLFKKIDLLLIIPPFLFSLLGGINIIEYGFNFLITFKLNIVDIFYLFFKFYIGPNPWNMFLLEGEYSPFWYCFTLLCILFCLFLRMFYQEFSKNFVIFIALFLSGFLPYAISHQNVDAVGPRQFAMIGPFLFLILYSKIFTSFRFHFEKVNIKRGIKIVFLTSVKVENGKMYV